MSLFTLQGARTVRVRTLNVGAKRVVRKGDIRALWLSYSDLGHVVSLLSLSFLYKTNRAAPTYLPVLQGGLNKVVYLATTGAQLREL